MIRLLADENFNNRTIRGLRLRMPAVDVVRAQEVGLAGVDDPDVLEWAATENRIVLTHDIQTMIGFAVQRVATGAKMPGLFVVEKRPALGKVIESLMILAECSRDDEWEGKVVFLPL